LEYQLLQHHHQPSIKNWRNLIIIFFFISLKERKKKFETSTGLGKIHINFKEEKEEGLAGSPIK